LNNKGGGARPEHVWKLVNEPGEKGLRFEKDPEERTAAEGVASR